MYSLRQLRRVVDQPKLFVREMNRLYHTRLGRRAYNPDGVDLMAAEWDNLLILDACRYDMFAARADDLSGVLEHRRSRASMTTEFLKANVDGRELHDTVYVAATPMLYWNRNRGEVTATFHQEVNVWRDGWDSEVNTVRPETTAKYAIRAAEEYPNKRLLVHFVQPHFPAIGPTGDDHPELRSMRVWDALDKGDIELSDRVLWQAFRENLDAVLPHVEELLETLGGRTVVTADHGQMIGERSFPIPFREYGHPPGIYTDELLTVPWLVSTNGPRRETVAEEPVAPPERGHETEPADMEADDDDVVTDRLEDLGYIV